jgi:hypothetical protein
MPDQEPSTTVSCGGCGGSVPEPGRIEDQKPCPSCGSTARTFAVTLTDKAEAHDSLATKARHGDVGKVKPYREALGGFDYHRDSKEWRQVSRVVDREGDRYTERIVDAAGNVVREVDEPLSDHRGRGTAKRRGSRPGPDERGL